MQQRRGNRVNELVLVVLGRIVVSCQCVCQGKTRLMSTHVMMVLLADRRRPPKGRATHEQESRKSKLFSIKNTRSFFFIWLLLLLVVPLPPFPIARGGFCLLG